MESQQITRADHLADDVGIVVIGRNEGERLIGCLASIDPRKVITVYVDSGSTDDSVTAAERLGALVVRLDMTQPFTAARARNEGFTALKMLRPELRFVQFVDGDCELDPGWLTTALAFIAERKDIAVVCGRRRERFPNASVYNWLCDLEWDTPAGEAKACGGDSLVRTAAFEAVDGFRSRLIAGEEPEFCLRLRQMDWNIWRLDVEMTRHDAAITRFGQWWRRAVRSGYAYAEVYQLHASSPTAIWKWELMRPVFWGGLMPLVILIGVFATPVAFAASLVYPLQICRIALRHGATRPRSWAYALFMTLAKFAEFQGVLKYLWCRWRGNTTELIEYKHAS
jgi:GT2 family glycosyltransferase